MKKENALIYLAQNFLALSLEVFLISLKKVGSLFLIDTVLVHGLVLIAEALFRFAQNAIN